MTADDAPQNYHEVQYFAQWVYWLLLACLLAAVAAPLMTGRGWTRENQHSAHLIIFISVMAALPLCLNILCMHTRVSNGMLYIHFGLLFPMLWKRILLHDIAGTRVVRYRPLRDAGGWGWRYGRFEGASCLFFNARGDTGVLVLTHAGKRYVVGSQYPDALKASLDEARNGSREN